MSGKCTVTCTVHVDVHIHVYMYIYMYVCVQTHHLQFAEGFHGINLVVVLHTDLHVLDVM